jgi:perosamine synthetase
MRDLPEAAHLRREPLARPEALDYCCDRISGTFAVLESVLVSPWNEKYTDEHIDYIADALHAFVAQLMT